MGKKNSHELLFRNFPIKCGSSLLVPKNSISLPPVTNQDIFTELSVFLHLSFIFIGAKAGGAAGFFKGLGKGVVGVVARPAGGLVDFASSTFEGIKGLVTFQNLTPF